MAAHPESGRKGREILNEYIDLRYRTYGDMEEVDPSCRPLRARRC